MKNYVFAGIDTVKMAEKYGTPLYLMDEDFIHSRIEEIQSDFLNKYDNTFAAYASKAFLNKEMARIIKDSPLGLDVVSGGELYLAYSVDFPMDRIIFHGNNKSKEELDLALKLDVGRIVVDNLYELELLGLLSEKYKKNINILFRISPGVDSDTHSYIQTAQEDSKFGISLNKDSIDEVFNLLASYKYLNYSGLHFHIGSQLDNSKSHIEAIDYIIDLILYLKENYNLLTKELNTGGGYGVDHLKIGSSKDLSYFIDPIMERIISLCRKNNIARPRVIIEPGRWLVANAGMTIYKVGSIKDIKNVRKYVSVDGGMTDNIRPSLYGAEYRAKLLNNLDSKREKELVTIAGKRCESGDILIKDIVLPKLKHGDYIGIFSTGAYNYSMSSNYNKARKAAVVMVNKGVDRLIVKRETYQDLIKNDI